MRTNDLLYHFRREGWVEGSADCWILTQAGVVKWEKYLSNHQPK